MAEVEIANACVYDKYVVIDEDGAPLIFHPICDHTTGLYHERKWKGVYSLCRVIAMKVRQKKLSPWKD